MAKIVFGLGFVIGLAILAIAITAEPPSSGVEAHESIRAELIHAAANTATQCKTREVALDQGYGVSRTVVQRICKDAR